MTWPPAELPIDFENATPQENTHPDAHNATNQTINADLVPEINRVGALAETIGLYLPLTGGTLTGDLQVDGTIKASEGAQAAPAITFGGAATGFYSKSDEAVTTAVNGVWQHIVYEDLVRIRKDLQVDGQIKGPRGSAGTPTFTSEDDPKSGFYAGNFSGQDHTAAITVNGHHQVVVNPDLTTIRNDLKVNGTINGQSVFGIAEGIDTADVLDRAETATMPAADDEVATTDAEVESITVNEVVTALLAKVKELSAEIKELKGA